MRLLFTLLRALLGMCVAPGIPAILLYVAMRPFNTHSDSLTNAASVAAPAYISAWLIGLPADVFLRIWRRTSLRVYVSLAICFAWLVGSLVFAIFGRDVVSGSVVVAYATMVSAATVVAAVTAVAYWLIAVRQLAVQPLDFEA